jgi:hypothetical protein
MAMIADKEECSTIWQIYLHTNQTCHKSAFISNRNSKAYRQYAQAGDEG